MNKQEPSQVEEAISSSYRLAGFASCEDEAAWTSEALKAEIDRSLEMLVQQTASVRRVSATFRSISKALAVSRNSSLADLQSAVRDDGSG